MYRIDQTCEEFLKGSGFDWEFENKALFNDVRTFEQTWTKSPTEVGEITYFDSGDRKYTSKEDFKFSYEIGWNIRT